MGLSYAEERCEVLLGSSSSNNVYILVSTFSLATGVKISCEGIFLSNGAVSANENDSSGSEVELEVKSTVELTLGQPSTAMSLQAGEGIVFLMLPSSAADGVTCTTSGTGGDLDLVMWFAEDEGDFECVSESLTNAETCSVSTVGRAGEVVIAFACALSPVRSVRILCENTF